MWLYLWREHILDEVTLPYTPSIVLKASRDERHFIARGCENSSWQKKEKQLNEIHSDINKSKSFNRKKNPNSERQKAKVVSRINKIKRIKNL